MEKGIKTFGSLKVALLVSLALTGCNDGGGGGGGDSSGGGQNLDGGGGGGGDSSGGGQNLDDADLKADIAGAESLLAHNQAVTASGEEKSVGSARQADTVSSDGRTLPTYEPFSQNLTKDQALQRRQQPPESRSSLGTRADDDEETTTEDGPSNLLAVDEDGSSRLALTTGSNDYPVKVNYSVTGPDEEYAYLALETEYSGEDDNDYGALPGQTNCAFYKVKLSDDSLSCVKEGVAVQTMDDDYMQTVSSNDKPIQFDGDGNLYFTGSEFDRQCDTYDGGEEYCWLDGGMNWDLRVYRQDDSTGEIEALTQDNEGVEYYTALDSGEVVYQVWNQDTGDQMLNMWQDGQTIDLSTNDWLEFFAAGDHKTVLWGGEWDTAGIEMARPTEQGGVHTTALKTKVSVDSSDNPVPKRVIEGDDGSLYGVYRTWRYDDETSDSETILSVFRILPYSPIPRVSVSLGDDNWWDWMGQTPFQVADGYLYYVETSDVSFDDANYGTTDTIHVVNLDTREEFEILAPETSEDPRYDIYSWQLSGDTLHFSALDQSRTVVVQGEVDTAAVKDEEGEDVFLSLKDMASATDSNLAIQDIEPIQSTTGNEVTDSPDVVAYYPEEGATTENQESVSVRFNKAMDKASVEDNLSLSDGAGATLDALPLWFGNTLHLVPDSTGMADTTYDGLALNTSYELALNTSRAPTDQEGESLCSTGTTACTVNFNTRHETGWYLATADDASGEFAAGDMAKFAEPASDNSYPEYELAATNIPVRDLRIEFSARNYDWSGLSVILRNENTSSEEFRVELDGWPSLRYDEDDDGYNEWHGVNDGYSAIMNGQWARYRVDTYGKDIEVSFCTDYDKANSVCTTDWISIAEFEEVDLNSATSTDEGAVRFEVSRPVAIDNLEISGLDSDGTNPSLIKAEEFSTTLPDELIDSVN